MIRKSFWGLLAGILLLPGVAAIAQVEVKGSVWEATTQQPIEQATVRLLTIKDSTLVTGVASGRDGAFALRNVKAGDYLLAVSFIGFMPAYETLRVTGKTAAVDVGRIELADDAVLLKEAVVTAKAIEVTVRNDTIEYNADSYKVTEGSALEELLKKMPGVEIDAEGKVTVNGKEIKRIMVDGKEFFFNDPKVATKNLPAKMVDKVQVLDRKSDMAMMTGFADGDEEAVINLTVKPGMKQGWFGNAYAGYGSRGRYEGNLMVNRFIKNDQFTLMAGLNNTNNMGFSDLGSSMFGGMGGGRRGGRFFGQGNGITESGYVAGNFSKEFSNKLTLGGDVRYSRSDNLSESKNRTENILPGDSTTFEYGTARQRTINDNLGVNLRLEWNPDTMTRLIFRPELSYSKTASDGKQDGYSMAGLKGGGATDTVNRTSAVNTSNGQGYDASAHLDFSRKLNNRGRVVSASVSGGYNNSYTDGYDYSDTRYLLSGTSTLIDQHVRYDNSGYNYRAFASWVEPLGRNNFLQLTYRFRQSRRESLKNAYNADPSGQYTDLDSTYSKNTSHEATEQRASLSFKAVRPKYNYTIGVNVDPSSTRTETFIGDKTLYTIRRNVVNVSPTAQLNYAFDRDMNLRIDYDGRVNQPSMSQLQPVADVSNPLNTVVGNPGLKPAYANNLRLRFHRFRPEQQAAFMVMADAGYTYNAIVPRTTTNAATNRRTTSYDNAPTGNFNGNMRVIYNTPLKNKKLSLFSMSWGMYGQSNEYINDRQNVNRVMILVERMGLNYRSDLFDFGLNGHIRYNRTRNSLQAASDLNTFNYGGGASLTAYLPWHWRLETDFTYSANSGYAAGYAQQEKLWNASLSKSFLKDNSATLRIKFYDILRDRSNMTYTTSSNSIRYAEYNTLTSYFMVHFIYRFSFFGGGASESDMRHGFGPGRGFGRPPGR